MLKLKPGILAEKNLEVKKTIPFFCKVFAKGKLYSNSETNVYWIVQRKAQE